MSRELNRDLFPSDKDSARKSVQGDTQVDEVAASKEDLRVLSYQIETLWKKVKEMDPRLERTQTRVQELSSSCKLRFERVQSHLQRQAEGTQGQFGDMHAKVAQLLSKVNETRLAENRIQEIVDRHQQVVRSFEARLTQLKKLVSEQELQLSASRAELKDALKEISRLKRL
ncbi:hypothetical protein GW916_02445 [bacterium]|nr:hypothetical protein [bacterium]